MPLPIQGRRRASAASITAAGVDEALAAAEAARLRLNIPDRLFGMEQLTCDYDADDAVLWTVMHPAGRPSFNPALLREFGTWQDDIASGFGPGKAPLDYLVLASSVPGVFCYGGDLNLFADLIRTGNRDGLIAYGKACVEILHRNIECLGQSLVTIGLVQGDALGGGWEALLSFNVIIAERGTRFGLPEVTFGLFPGMGAHAILARKVGTATAERMILSGRSYSAEELFELGLVHKLADPGEGVAVTRDYIRRERRRHAGHVGAYRAMRLAAPLPLSELVDIVTLWADTALQLSEQDLKLMQRIVAAQSRRVGDSASALDGAAAG